MAFLLDFAGGAFSVAQNLTDLYDGSKQDFFAIY